MLGERKRKVKRKEVLTEAALKPKRPKSVDTANRQV